MKIEMMTNTTVTMTTTTVTMTTTTTTNKNDEDDDEGNDECSEGAGGESNCDEGEDCNKENDDNGDEKFLRTDHTRHFLFIFSGTSLSWKTFYEKLTVELQFPTGIGVFGHMIHGTQIFPRFGMHQTEALVGTEHRHSNA